MDNSSNEIIARRQLLGPVDKVRQPPADRREIKEAGERERSFVVAGGNASLVLEVAEHALDAVTVAIAAEVAGDGLVPIGLWRDDRQDAVHQKVRSDPVAIISFVRQQGVGLGNGQCHEIVDRAIIGRLAAGQDEAERASLIVATGVDLARKAAA